MSNANHHKAVAAIATVPALAAPAGRTTATSHQDAELLRLYHEQLAVHRLVKDLAAQMSAVVKQYAAECPPLPRACRFRRSDERLGLTKHDYYEGRVSGYAVEKLRKLGRGQDQIRAREIVEAYDDWSAAVEKLRAKHGIDKLEEEFDAAVSVRSQIGNAMLNTRANTLEGLKAKAWAALAFNGDDPKLLLQKIISKPVIITDGAELEDVVCVLAASILELS
jgi:hypothetical protein